MHPSQQSQPDDQSLGTSQFKLADGSPIPEELDFFAPPPPEIGAPLVATSTLNHSTKRPRILNRLLIAVLVSISCALVLFIVGVVENPRDQDERLILGIIGAVVGLFAGLVIAFRHVFKGDVYYISADGIARIR